jgi:hypothetical protein
VFGLWTGGYFGSHVLWLQFRVGADAGVLLLPPPFLAGVQASELSVD